MKSTSRPLGQCVQFLKVIVGYSSSKLIPAVILDNPRSILYKRNKNYEYSLHNNLNRFSQRRDM